MWFTASRHELQAERIHYTILANLVQNNRFNAIKYLYDRLNIIDSKAQGLLTRNGLLLTTVSIVASTQIGKNSFLLHNIICEVVLAVAYLLLVVSTLSTVGIMLLRFDSVTIIPGEAQAQLQHACTCPSPRPGVCAAHPPCAFKLLQAEIDALGITGQHVALSHARCGHSLAQYEDLFFEITIKRQKFLRLAQVCTIWSMVMFFGLIGGIFVQDALTTPLPAVAIRK